MPSVRDDTRKGYLVVLAATIESQLKIKCNRVYWGWVGSDNSPYQETPCNSGVFLMLDISVQGSKIDCGIGY